MNRSILVAGFPWEDLVQVERWAWETHHCHFLVRPFDVAIRVLLEYERQPSGIILNSLPHPFPYNECGANAFDKLLSVALGRQAAISVIGVLAPQGEVLTDVAIFEHWPGQIWVQPEFMSGCYAWDAAVQHVMGEYL